MIGYRVRQFYSGLTAKIDEEDMEFVKVYLNDEENQLFCKLSIYEQKHSIKVAKGVIDSEKKQNIKSAILAKAALLHDIGKIETKLNIVDISALVVLNKISRGRMRKFNKLKKVDVFYNHPDKGYNILKKYNYDERFLYLIKNHHNQCIFGDTELDILKECDNNN